MKKNNASKKTLSIIFLSSLLLTSTITFPIIQSTIPQNNIDTFAVGEGDYEDDDYRKHLNTEGSCEDPNNCSEAETVSLLPTYSVPTEIWDPLYQGKLGKESGFTGIENNKDNGTRRRFFYHYLTEIGLEVSAKKYFEPNTPTPGDGSEGFVDETKFEEIILEVVFPTSNPFKVPGIYSGSEWFNSLDDSYGLSIEMDGVLYDKTAYEDNPNRPEEEYIFEYERTYVLVDDSKHGAADKGSIEIVEDRDDPTQFITPNTIEEGEGETSKQGGPIFYEMTTEEIGENIQSTISNKADDTDDAQYIYTISSHPDGELLWANGGGGIIMSYGLSSLYDLDLGEGLFHQLAKLPLKHIRVPLRHGTTGVEMTYEAGIPEVFSNPVYPTEYNELNGEDIKPTTFESKFLSGPNTSRPKKYSDFSNTARVLDFPKQDEIPFDEIVVSDEDKTIGIALIVWASLMIVGGISLFIFSKVKHNAMVSYYDKKSGKGNGSK